VKLLLDTHALLWFDGGDRRLSARARRALDDEAAELMVSAASDWSGAGALAADRISSSKAPAWFSSFSRPIRSLTTRPACSSRFTSRSTVAASSPISRARPASGIGASGCRKTRASSRP